MIAGLLAVLLSCQVGTALADSTDILPSKDNTLYDYDPNVSNGAGAYVFSGLTSALGLRRALLAFDLCGKVPGGSTITAATVTLHVSRSRSPNNPMTLQRLLADWGEGASDAQDPGGTGAPAEPGDATWVYRFYPSVSWTTPGGDYTATVSASTLVSGIGFYTWGSTATMVSDVQSWLNSPASNYGYILIGNEGVFGSAIRFDSRENPDDTVRPRLRIAYNPPPTAPAGAVPNGADVPGPQLLVTKSGTNLTLTWGASCNVGDTDYEIYEGVLGSFTSHVPLTCGTCGQLATTISPGAGDHYYLVVPRSGGLEGSYGRSTAGERPQSASSCLPQSIAACM